MKTLYKSTWNNRPPCAAADAVKAEVLSAGVSGGRLEYLEAQHEKLLDIVCAIVDLMSDKDAAAVVAATCHSFQPAGRGKT